MRKVILEAVVGSTAHGTSVNDGLEDLDLMAIVLEDAVEERPDWHRVEEWMLATYLKHWSST